MSDFTNKKFQQETAGQRPEEEKKQKIRLTFHSTDLKAIEKVCTAFVAAASSKNFKTKGPVRMPLRKLTVTTRKSPCGQGTNTYDKFEMRLYKRIIDIFGTPHQMSSISTLASVEPNVDVEVVLMD